MTYERDHTIFVRIIDIYDIVSYEETQKQQLAFVKLSMLDFFHVFVNGFEEAFMGRLEALVVALWEGDVRMDAVSVLSFSQSKDTKPVTLVKAKLQRCGFLAGLRVAGHMGHDRHIQVTFIVGSWHIKSPRTGHVCKRCIPASGRLGKSVGVQGSIGTVTHIGMARYIFVAMGHVGEAGRVCISTRHQGRMGYIPSHMRHIHMAPRWLSHIANNLLACWAG
jgi:hypothetical protein